MAPDGADGSREARNEARAESRRRNEARAERRRRTFQITLSGPEADELYQVLADWDRVESEQYGKGLRIPVQDVLRGVLAHGLHELATSAATRSKV